VPSDPNFEAQNIETMVAETREGTAGMPLVAKMQGTDHSYVDVPGETIQLAVTEFKECGDKLVIDTIAASEPIDHVDTEPEESGENLVDKSRTKPVDNTTSNVRHSTRISHSNKLTPKRKVSKIGRSTEAVEKHSAAPEDPENLCPTCGITTNDLSYASIFCDACHHWYFPSYVRFHELCADVDVSEKQGSDRWTCGCDEANKVVSRKRKPVVIESDSRQTRHTLRHGTTPNEVPSSVKKTSAMKRLESKKGSKSTPKASAPDATVKMHITPLASPCGKKRKIPEQDVTPVIPSSTAASGMKKRKGKRGKASNAVTDNDVSSQLISQPTEPHVATPIVVTSSTKLNSGGKIGMKSSAKSKRASKAMAVDAPAEEMLPISVDVEEQADPTVETSASALTPASARVVVEAERSILTRSQTPTRTRVADDEPDSAKTATPTSVRANIRSRLVSPNIAEQGPYHSLRRATRSQTPSNSGTKESEAPSSIVSKISPTESPSLFGAKLDDKWRSGSQLKLVSVNRVVGPACSSSDPIVSQLDEAGAAFVTKPIQHDDAEGDSGDSELDPVLRPSPPDKSLKSSAKGKESMVSKLVNRNTVKQGRVGKNGKDVRSKRISRLGTATTAALADLSDSRNTGSDLVGTANLTTEAAEDESRLASDQRRASSSGTLTRSATVSGAFGKQVLRGKYGPGDSVDLADCKAIPKKSVKSTKKVKVRSSKRTTSGKRM
jgi:hypothetical protein